MPEEKKLERELEEGKLSRKRLSFVLLLLGLCAHADLLFFGSAFSGV